MTRKEFDTMDFEKVMERLNEEVDEVTTYDTLIDFIKYQLDKENNGLALHILQAIYEDDNPDDTEWYLYDYNMGTMETPTSVSCKEDVEHLIED